MGFMTSIGILNDDWPRIAENPERLVKQIAYGMNGGKGPSDFSSVTVLPSHHADQMEIILADRNEFYPLTSYPSMRYKNLAEKRKTLLHAQIQIKAAQTRLQLQLDAVEADIQSLPAEIEV